MKTTYEDLAKQANLSRLSVCPISHRVVTCADMSRSFAETDLCDGTVEEREARASLIAHWGNNFEQVVAALEYVDIQIGQDPRYSELPVNIKAAYSRVHTVLAAVQTVAYGEAKAPGVPAYLAIPQLDDRIKPDLTPHPDWEIIPRGTALQAGDHVWLSADAHSEVFAGTCGRVIGGPEAPVFPEGFYRRRKGVSPAESEPRRYEGDGTPPENTKIDRACYPVGISVDAEPKDGDFAHAFRGTVAGHDKGMIQVRDQVDNVFDCEPSQLSIPDGEELP
jgi:hypothetical protein